MPSRDFQAHFQKMVQLRQLLQLAFEALSCRVSKQAISLALSIFNICSTHQAMGQTIVVTPNSVVQSFQPEGAMASAGIMLSGSGSVQLSASTQSGGNWLSVSPAGGSLPLSATVTMDPSGLPNGTYLGSIKAGSTTIPITILVGNPGPQLPSNGVVSAANYQGGAVSPGEVVAIFGQNIGPTIPYSAQVWDGIITSKLAGSRVWFDNTPAPVIYAYPNQLAVVVPFNVAGKKTVQVQVENLVARTPPFSLPVKDAIPAFFTADGSGQGQLAALNQDTSINSVTNPAEEGSPVVLYATGLGAFASLVADGTLLTSAPLPSLVQSVQVSIGGQNAEVLYAGPAPTLVAGVMQINVRVPTGIAGGSVPVTLVVGAVNSAVGTTISVR